MGAEYLMSADRGTLERFLALPLLTPLAPTPIGLSHLQ